MERSPLFLFALESCRKISDCGREMEEEGQRE